MKAVIFDFDYTLGDSTDGIVQSVSSALFRLGRPPADREAVRRAVGLSLKETYRVLTGRENPEEEERFAAYFMEKADEVMVASTVLYPDTKAVLRQLRARGCRLAVVTTKHHSRIAGILDRYDAAELVDRVVGCDDVKIEKPHPEGLLRVIDELGVENQDTLYVGDSLVDANTAKNAGVRFAAVLTGATAAEEFRPYRPSLICPTLTALYEAIAPEL